MKSLDQIRAEHAVQSASSIGRGTGDGDAVRGFPMLVRQCGLLGALAFAVERKRDKGGAPPAWKNGGHYTIASALTSHLRTCYADGKSGITNSQDPLALVSELCAADAIVLRHATSEALEWLKFLKRFAAAS